MYAYESGNYATCAQLCDKLVAVTVNGDYAKLGLNELRQAAHRAKQGEIADVKWENEILPFDAFDMVDLKKLLETRVAKE